MATEELRIIIRAQDQASQVIRNINAETNNLMTNAVRGAAAGVGFFAAQQIQQAISQGFRAATDAVIGFNASLEQSRIAWATMLGGAQQANAMLAQLQEFAEASPIFEFAGVERAGRRLLAMGFAARDIIPILTDVGNAAAALGLGTEGIDRITLALGQMSARTKVSAQDMLQLTEVGIPAWQILAQATGQSVAQVQQASEKGQIASQTFIDAFRRFSQERWGGLAEAQSRTFQGAMQSLQDSSRRVLAEAFTPLFEGISRLVQAFAAFAQSQGMKDMVTGLRNAQIAVGVFLDTVARSEPILNIMKAALLGVAVAAAVGFSQSIAAAGAAALLAARNFAVMAASLALANLPLTALAIAAAAAAILIIANWDQITKATEGMVAQVTAQLQIFTSWVAQAGQSAWEAFANFAIDALNAVISAWNTFWSQGLGTSGQTGFTQLQQMAQAGWDGFVNLAVNSLREVLEVWNAFIGVITGLSAIEGIDLPFGLEQLSGRFVDITAVTKDFNNALNEVPGIASQASNALQRFVAEDLPAGVARAIELVQAAGGDLSQLGPRIIEEIQKRANEITGLFGDLGQKAGADFGQNVVKAAQPLIESLQRMFAQLRAAPATQALEDIDRAIERAKLVVADLSQAPEARQAAIRQMIELQLRVRPRAALEAFDVGEDVRLATRAEQTAKLLQDIFQAQIALAGGATGGATATGIATGAPAAVAPAAPPPPTQVNLRIEVTADGTTQIYEELIEANGQALSPPTIQVSGLRRN